MSRGGRDSRDSIAQWVTEVVLVVHKSKLQPPSQFTVKAVAVQKPWWYFLYRSNVLVFSSFARATAQTRPF
ncbi:hypothetical protein SCG7086_AR_00140 [Chlamydiales bacterium SCGC AG-110-P3]|nr:hypothetical protein SCG7086_AR_00140 [Chlamydiales bacterium SCGC AG-110-P3]